VNNVRAHALHFDKHDSVIHVDHCNQLGSTVIVNWSCQILVTWLAGDNPEGKAGNNQILGDLSI